MEITYILSQICVAIAYIVLGIGMRKEKRMQILIHSNIYNVFLITSYALLGGISGIISCGLSFLRNFIYMYDEKKNKSTSNIVLIIFAILSIILTILFYKNPIDILPCVLTVITIYTVGSRNTKITRCGSLFASVCWIIYAIAFKSWFVIVCESYLAICTIIGLIKYNLKKENKKTEATKL